MFAAVAFRDVPGDLALGVFFFCLFACFVPGTRSVSCAVSWVPALFPGFPACCWFSDGAGWLYVLEFSCFLGLFAAIAFGDVPWDLASLFFSLLVCVFCPGDSLSVVRCFLGPRAVSWVPGVLLVLGSCWLAVRFCFFKFSFLFAAVAFRDVPWDLAPVVFLFCLFACFVPGTRLVSCAVSRVPVLFPGLTNLAWGFAEL